MRVGGGWVVVGMFAISVDAISCLARGPAVLTEQGEDESRRGGDALAGGETEVGFTETGAVHLISLA